MDLQFFRRSPRERVNAIVLQAIEVTPRMRRLVLGGPDLAAWLESDGVGNPAAWVKVFPAGREGRAYTIRRVDATAGTLDIDFVLHGDQGDDGAVSDWARLARRGDQVGIAGPRHGGFDLQSDTRWIWLAADASALAAAQSILESLPRGLHAHALLVVDDEGERQPVQSGAHVDIQWRYAFERAYSLEATDPLLTTIASLRGAGQVWMAGEATWVRNWRAFWLEHQNVDRSRVVSKGYWKVGSRDHRD
ncbi:siderophore-interacting protein [Burkholderia sp. Ac-20384]|uniref:Vibriobactin utilization protein ViuB n=1 Tax=Burkholderia lata (strain ATCC 17760 / DSM 23089 / LMG 22485 / NCIMB 9086 / R18194 / 383) TaxID=482957 RepID=A0A833PM65_BURL3|nr:MULTISPECIES: siderophore-interacting protein [Burkholderia]KAF1035330.1 MAG: Vibriobactin utilization protein ViuB [Burkholderia lata]MBN3823322.1 siderophore-interacting protein [Burkholderia sp. Ac-20384]